MYENNTGRVEPDWGYAPENTNTNYSKPTRLYEKAQPGMMTDTMKNKQQLKTEKIMRKQMFRNA